VAELMHGHLQQIRTYDNTARFLVAPFTSSALSRAEVSIQQGTIPIIYYGFTVNYNFNIALCLYLLVANICTGRQTNRQKRKPWA